MQLLCVHVYLVLLSILEHVNVVGAAPCQQTTSIMRSYQNTICTSRFWGTCTHHAFVWRYYVEYRKICCVGYGGPNCQPVCSSGCNGRGTCVALEQCSCDNSYTGNACQTPVCSLSCGHGTCIQPNTCSCHYGYTGRLCNTHSPDLEVQFDSRVDDGQLQHDEQISKSDIHVGQGDVTDEHEDAVDIIERFEGILGDQTLKKPNIRAVTQETTSAIRDNEIQKMFNELIERIKKLEKNKTSNDRSCFLCKQPYHFYRDCPRNRRGPNIRNDHRYLPPTQRAYQAPRYQEGSQGNGRPSSQ
uniref:EGF-like domain-containing protein n=1 Tax=Magallana gigas TaxID=29159 RepID=A0A8W8I5B4_MAGGI